MLAGAAVGISQLVSSGHGGPGSAPPSLSPQSGQAAGSAAVRRLVVRRGSGHGLNRAGRVPGGHVADRPGYCQRTGTGPGLGRPGVPAADRNAGPEAGGGDRQGQPGPDPDRGRVPGHGPPRRRVPVPGERDRQLPGRRARHHTGQRQGPLVPGHQLQRLQRGGPGRAGRTEHARHPGGGPAGRGSPGSPRSTTRADGLPRVRSRKAERPAVVGVLDGERSAELPSGTVRLPARKITSSVRQARRPGCRSAMAAVSRSISPRFWRSSRAAGARCSLCVPSARPAADEPGRRAVAASAIWSSTSPPARPPHGPDEVGQSARPDTGPRRAAWPRVPGPPRYGPAWRRPACGSPTQPGWARPAAARPAARPPNPAVARPEFRLSASAVARPAARPAAPPPIRAAARLAVRRPIRAAGPVAGRAAAAVPTLAPGSARAGRRIPAASRPAGPESARQAPESSEPRRRCRTAGRSPGPDNQSRSYCADPSAPREETQISKLRTEVARNTQTA